MGSPLLVVVGALTLDVSIRVSPSSPPSPLDLRADLSSSSVLPGSDPETLPSGGGVHVAIAAARLGASVHLLGRVGSDDTGSRLLSALDTHGVATGFVTITDDIASGTAIKLRSDPPVPPVPTVPPVPPVPTASAPGLTVLCPGANARLSPDDIDRALPLIRTAGALVVQLGIPVETALHALRVAHRSKVPVILSPVPLPQRASDLPRELFDVSLLSIGLSTARRLSPEPSPEHRQLASHLLARGSRSVVLKLGEHGSLHASAPHSAPNAAQPHTDALVVPGFRIKPKDTSLAGFAFDAALAVALMENRPPAEMLRFANAAGGLACTQPPGPAVFPNRLDVEDLVKRWG